MKPRIHFGYAVAAVGYMLAIFVLSADEPGGSGRTWSATAMLLRVPLIACLVVCLLLAFGGGRWNRPLAWPLYVPIAGIAAVYAAWRYASVAEVTLSCAGIGMLVVLHRLAGSRATPS